jgi:Ca-activated chloride channel homolog
MLFHRRTPFAFNFLFTILVTLLCACPVLAQNCKTCLGSALGVSGGLPANTTSTSSNLGSVFFNLADTGDPWTIRKRVNEVTVFFTATKGHKFVDDLREQEVSVTDDNRPAAKISAFGHQTDLPLRLGLLIDTSNSVNYRFNFEREAARRFLQKIVRSETDQAFVMGFSDQTILTQDYTDNAEELANGISALRSDGSTALFDAVRASCLKLARAAGQGPTARILVLLSDGEDNSSKSTLEQTIETAQREEITIYTITTNNNGYNGAGDQILKNLAVQTGGQIFSRESAKETIKAFSLIEQEMRSRYALAYQPSDLLEDGRFHRIEIRAQRLNKKFHVHARKGYYARLELSDN